MQIELSVTSARSKARVLDALRRQGYQVAPGGVRLAYPFTLLVEDVDEPDLSRVLEVAQRVEPCAGTIAPAAAAAS